MTGPRRPEGVLHVAAVDFTAIKLLKPQLDFLADRGFRVRLACRVEDKAAAEELARFEPIRLTFPRSPRPREVLSGLAGLLRAVREQPPELLHLHTPAAALAVRSVPRAVWPREMRMVYTVHGFFHAWPPVGTRDIAIQALERLQSRRTDMMLFQSDEDLHEATARRYATRLRPLGNGVEDAWFDLPPPRRSEKPLRLLYTGRLVREKGVIELLHAVAACPAVHLTVVGSALSSDRDGLEAEAKLLAVDLGVIERVKFRGMLPRRDVITIMQQSDCLVLPSYREGMPRSVMEAMAAGRPCIVTDIRGSRELVRDGREGFVVPAASRRSLTEAIKRMADLGHAAVQEMSVAARGRANELCRESVVFGRLLEAYEELGVRPGTC